MPVDDPATLEQGRRPYHPLFLPRLSRDDTPGAPFAGLWTATVPRPADRATRAAGVAAAYFADLADARTWALSAWRGAHHLAADAFCVIPAVATYTVDPQDPDAAARWEQTTGAALAAAGAQVVLRRFTTPTPQRVPGPRPRQRLTPADLVLLDHPDLPTLADEVPAGPAALYDAGVDPTVVAAEAAAIAAAEGRLTAHEAGPEDRIAGWRATQAEQARLGVWRARLIEAGFLSPTDPVDPDTLFTALRDVRQEAPDLWAQWEAEDTDTPAVGAYAGSRFGYLTTPPAAPAGPPPERPAWAHWWILTPLRADCWVLWRPAGPDREPVFFDTDHPERPGWFPTAAAARAAAQAADPTVTVTGREDAQFQLSDRLSAAFRQAFYRRHPEALRVGPPTSTAPGAAPAVPVSTPPRS